MSDFVLTPFDKANGTWLRLREQLEDRLASARLRNDDVTHSEQATAALRGEIRVLKSLIRLGDDRPVVTAE